MLMASTSARIFWLGTFLVDIEQSGSLLVRGYLGSLKSWSTPYLGRRNGVMYVGMTMNYLQ